MLTQKTISKYELFKKLFQNIALITFVMIWPAACAPVISPAVDTMTAPVPMPQEIQTYIASREAQVQSVEIQITGRDPAHVNAAVRGNLTESCAMLGESQVRYESSTIRITVYAVSLSDIGCVQTITPFETTIPLNSKDLPAGTYAVIVNGVSTIFTVPVVNPTPSPEHTNLPDPTTTRVPIITTCSDSAKFISDVTIPDGTGFTPNTPFTKIWRLKNTGTCTWDSDYLVAYISGTTMSQQPGYWIIQPGQTVEPGQTVDVSVGMTSPVDNGNYASYWGLKKAEGNFLPIQDGANGNSFFVKIKVNNGVADGNITAASINIELEQGSGAVCTANSTYFVHASITADEATTAMYEIGSTAGQISAGYFQSLDDNGLSPYVTGTVTFDQPETKTINYRFVGPYPYPSDITINLRVNDGEWYQTKLSCQ